MNFFNTIAPIFIFLLFGIGLVTEESVKADSPEREIAIVLHFDPNVDVKDSSKDTFDQPGRSLFSGDTLTTDEKGYALVTFMDQSVVKVCPLSELIIRGEMDRNQNENIRIDLNRGGVFLNVNRQVSSEFEITTASTMATVKGTSFGVISNGYYWVEQGMLEVMALQSGQTISVRKGMFAQVDESGTDITTGQLSEKELGRLNSQYNALDESLIQRRLIFSLRAANGQILEEGVEFNEPNNN
ncbi:FecR family protein [Rhodohalobacter barkolensis]|uniref:FecR protein domain-containing protein n=1 Tax=Rhodohalobacter barkolensis TaxID=2053187 RepID=A0A2N0VFZ6_9BACT|nr:FecR family protein [Rhodohalobacter barkolensis]PKD43113.1 hypothetical protein CWD77_10820 [Rhodohalobacter barkolensis]